MVFESSVDIGPFWEYLNGLSGLDFTLELPTDEGLPFIGTSVQNKETMEARKGEGAT